jgi:hypothetical protein
VLLALSVAATTAGCATRAGQPPIRHPLLRAESGRPQLSPAPRGALFAGGAAPADTPEARRARESIARAAHAAVGQKEIVTAGHRWRMDCSGVARGIYAKAGFALGSRAERAGENDTSAIFRWVKENGSLRKSAPAPGDLVFFDNTWDQNKNGRRDDPLSHIGVVERVTDDGTVVFVHHVAGGILRYRMNLDRPHDRRDAKGEVLNHYLRRAEGGEPPKTTAELFVAFGTVLVRDDDRLIAHR